MSEAGDSVRFPSRTYVRFQAREGWGWGGMVKRYDETVEVLVERDAGLPTAFTWRERRYEIADVIGRWRLEGR